MESRDRITVYIDTDGLVTVQIPKGVMPDRNAIRAVVAAINAERRRRHATDEMDLHRGDRAADDCIIGDTVTIP